MRTRALLLTILALALAGCGGAEVVGPTPETVAGTVQTEDTETDAEAGGTEVEGDPAKGKAIFTESCGSCHVLEAAGTAGTFGPNLDEANASYDETEMQVRNGGGGMPAFEGQLSDEQIADVSAFVVESTAK